MRKTFFTVLLLSVIAAGCAKGASVAGSISLQTAYGQEFVLSNMYQNMKITITFDKDRVYGFSGVNRYSGAYSITGGKVAFSEMVSTMMAGSEDAMKAEQDYLIQLNSGGALNFDGSVLTIGKLSFKAKN